MVDFYLLTTFFFTIASVTGEKIPHVDTVHDTEAKEFASLLNNIINVNQVRMNGVKTLMNQLNMPYPPRVGGVRTESDQGSSSDEDSESSDGREVAFLVLPQIAVPRSAASVGLHQEAEGSRELGMNLEGTPKNEDTFKGGLRSRSKSYRRCKSACKAAYRNACSTYSCKRRLKKELKKECKRACKLEFKSGSSIDSDEDDW